MARNRLYCVQLIINVPVWAPNDGKASEIARTDALYEETTQLQQGDTKPVIGGIESVKDMAEAKRLGWEDETLPWGRKDQTPIVDLLKESG